LPLPSPSSLAVAVTIAAAAVFVIATTTAVYSVYVAVVAAPFKQLQAIRKCNKNDVFPIIRSKDNYKTVWAPKQSGRYYLPARITAGKWQDDSTGIIPTC
jgi:hypothetical protein